MVSVMNQVKKEYEGKVSVKVIDVDASKENYNLAVKYKITAVPTLIFLNADGSEYTRELGFTPQKDIEDIFSKMGVKQ